MEYQRFLLAECVQAYLPLDAEQQQEFERLVATEAYQGVRAMNTTWFEKGIAKGQRELLREQLDKRFGPLSPPVLDRLNQWPAERLSALGVAILEAQSLRELGLED
jgi:hypothetical protein